MSPEQARGRAVDKRSDIRAFGAVVYEMLTGRRAFDGEDVSDTLANTLKREPDWSALPPDTPAALARVVRRCLVKDSRQRTHDMGDVRIELEDGANAEAAPATQIAVGGRSSRLAGLERAPPADPSGWIVRSLIAQRDDGGRSEGCGPASPRSYRLSAVRLPF